MIIIQNKSFAIRRMLRNMAKRMGAPPDLTRRAEHFALDRFELDHCSASAAIKSGETWLKAKFCNRYQSPGAA